MTAEAVFRVGVRANPRLQTGGLPAGQSRIIFHGTANPRLGAGLKTEGRSVLRHAGAGLGRKREGSQGRAAVRVVADKGSGIARGGGGEGRSALRLVGSSASPRLFQPLSGAGISRAYSRNAGAAAGSQEGSLGITMGGSTYYDPQIPFKDVMRGNGDSFRESDGSFTLTISSTTGYPTSAIPGGKYAWATILAKQNGLYRPGTYIVKWTGDADVVAHVGSDCTGWTLINPNRGEATISPQAAPNDDGFQIRLTRNNASSPVGDIVVVHEDDEASMDADPWNPAMIAQLRQFGGIRMMDAVNYGKSGLELDRPDTVNVADRVPIGWQTYTSSHEGRAHFLPQRGWPIERQAQLAAKLGCHAWFCIPHAASEAYVRLAAQIIRDEFLAVTPGKLAFVERSNEPWNGIFDQLTYFRDQGVLLFPPGETDFEYVLHGYAWHSYTMFRWFEEELGATYAPRLRRLINTQFSNSWVATEILDTICDDGQPCYKRVDYLAPALYFGQELGADAMVATVKANTDAQNATLCRDELRGNAGWPGNVDIPLKLSEHRAIAQARTNALGNKLKLIAYESGQHLVGLGANNSDQALAAKFDSLNRSSLMGDLYAEDFLEAWRTGGTFGQVADPVFCRCFLFSNIYRPAPVSGSGPWHGWWGLEESYGDGQPKMARSVGWQATNPKWYVD